MYDKGFFNVLVLEIVIAAFQPSDVLIHSWRLFVKAEHGIDVISPLALGESSP